MFESDFERDTNDFNALKWLQIMPLQDPQTKKEAKVEITSTHIEL